MYNRENTISLSESEFRNVIKEAVSRVLAEADRHREGYYDDYAERTGKKDRHSPGYYQRYREKKKEEEQSTSQADGKEREPVSPKSKKNGKKKSRKAYYHKYNQEHPERLNRGFTKGYVNGNVKDGKRYDALENALRNRETAWHDDDWCETYRDEFD